MRGLISVVTLATLCGGVLAGSGQAARTNAANLGARGIVATSLQRSMAMKSVHFAGPFHEEEAGPGFSLKLSGRFQGDASGRPEALRMIQQTKVGKQPLSVTTVETLSKVAQQTNKGKWKCSKVTSSTATSLQDLHKFIDLLRKPGAHAKFALRGTRMYRGVRVWSIYANVAGVLPSSLLGLATTARYSHVIFVGTVLVNRHNYLLERVIGTATTHDKSTTDRLRLSVTFSKYGQAVRIRLPASCVS
jgi:hypothetical protein